MKEKLKAVPAWAAAITFLFLIACVTFMTVGLKTPPHIPLLISAVAAAGVGAACHFRWSEMQEGILDTTRPAIPAVLIIMTIGLLIGAPDYLPAVFPGYGAAALFGGIAGGGKLAFNNRDSWGRPVRNRFCFGCAAGHDSGRDCFGCVFWR